MDKLIAEIKKKKELQSISSEVVSEQLQKFLQQHPRLKLDNPRSAEYKQAVKEVRAKLRRSYGLFRQEEVSYDNQKKAEDLLTSHSSTRERLSFYHQFYQQLFKITGVPKTILDLGCGINPLSYDFMHLNGVEYYAYDINEREIKLLNEYFLLNEGKGLFGKAYVMDVSKVNEIKRLPPADLTFLFKITDILDQGKGHKKTEEVLLAVPSKWIVISFPTLTMSGKPMNAPRRKWMEWLCQRLGYEFSILEFSNEIFYVVRKQ